MSLQALVAVKGHLQHAVGVAVALALLQEMGLLTGLLLAGQECLSFLAAC